jgi:cyclopropane-fatty-acyl-phospholipid synthase
LATVTAPERALLQRLRKRVVEAPVRVVLWDGSAVDLSSEPPQLTITVRDRRTLLKLLWDPAVQFGEAYATGGLDVSGDLGDLIEHVFRGWKDVSWLRDGDRSGHDVRTARRNARHHYDVGNDFYRLWLDERMVYTCAYFDGPQMTLEKAQEAKLDYVCRKLRLRAGEHVLEAGCGWGALAMWMAKRYGVSVVACNVSKEQIQYARERAAAEGLDGRVRFLEDDYRNVVGRFDAVVSVGMLEHVGRDAYGALSAQLRRWLHRAHGRGLLHFIGRSRPAPLNAWVRDKIFPGAYPPTLGQVMSEVLEPAGLAVQDVENLRLHYAATIRHWRTRFEAAVPAIAHEHGEGFVRTWRLYLAGSEAAFRTGFMQLFQVTFTAPDNDDVPRTRAGLYQPSDR